MIKVGQTWRNGGGQMMTAKNVRFDGRIVVAREGVPSHSYSVDVNGGSVLEHGSERCLVERVTRVYIAGPMSGKPGLNFPAFHAAAADYRKRGCFVINPAEINGGSDELTATREMTQDEYQEHWLKCMRADIAGLLSCEMIVMLDGWTASRGASLEHHIARELGFAVVHP
jgi:hypothetical protein